MTKGLYRGYSSHEYDKNRSLKINDVELVKLDLLNHIFTRRGERVMMPTFGTRIPDLPFEPMDSITLDILRNDLLEVFNFDPRVKVLDLRITPNPDENSILATARLLYIELNLIDNLDLNIIFEGETS
jgi:phage baseplate assembly protein W